MLKVLPASHFSQDFPIFYTKTYKERQLSLPSIHSLPVWHYLISILAIQQISFANSATPTCYLLF